MFRKIVLIIATLAGLGLAGCSDSKSGPEAKYRIAVIPKGLDHEFWQSIERGADRAAEDIKAQKSFTVEVLWRGPLKENDARAQIDIINRNIADRVSGIALAPQHSQTMVPSVKEAVRENIPVVIFDSGLADQEPILKYIATNNYHGGELAAEALLKALRESGKPAPRLVLFRYQVGSESTDQREKGFEDYVNRVIDEQKKKGEPTITWLSRDKYAGATLDTALREAGPLLTSLTDQGIDGIFAPNESSAHGMVSALRNLGLNKNVKLVGFDSSPPLLQAVKDGDIEALIVQDPYKMGYLSVWTLVLHLEGYNVAPDGQKVQSTGEFVLTRANQDERATKERFDAEFQKQRRMEVPNYPKR
jgi:ribose transport system substrate-binding protein